jgi:hypothetical protein
MIETISSGILSRSSPRSTSWGSVVAARVSEASTPMEPLTSRVRPACSPGSETATPSTSMRGPWATKGIRSANAANGSSMIMRGAR